MKGRFVHQLSEVRLAAAGDLTIGVGSVVSWSDTNGRTSSTEYGLVVEIGHLRDYRGVPRVGDTIAKAFLGRRIHQGTLVSLPSSSSRYYRVVYDPDSDSDGEGDDNEDLTYAEYCQVAKQQEYRPADAMNVLLYVQLMVVGDADFSDEGCDIMNHDPELKLVPGDQFVVAVDKIDRVILAQSTAAIARRDRGTAPAWLAAPQWPWFGARWLTTRR